MNDLLDEFEQRLRDVENARDQYNAADIGSEIVYWENQWKHAAISVCNLLLTHGPTVTFVAEPSAEPPATVAEPTGHGSRVFSETEMRTIEFMRDGTWFNETQLNSQSVNQLYPTVLERKEITQYRLNSFGVAIVDSWRDAADGEAGAES